MLDNREEDGTIDSERNRLIKFCLTVGGGGGGGDSYSGDLLL
jgi:hypothetical protein